MKNNKWEIRNCVLFKISKEGKLTLLYLFIDCEVPRMPKEFWSIAPDTALYIKQNLINNKANINIDDESIYGFAPIWTLPKECRSQIKKLNKVKWEEKNKIFPNW